MVKSPVETTLIAALIFSVGIGIWATSRPSGPRATFNERCLALSGTPAFVRGERVCIKPDAFLTVPPP